MILMLARVLDVPLRERNDLLMAAGYAAMYRATDLDAPPLEQARRALDFMLRQQEPYPAIVVDRSWNLLKANNGAVKLVETFADASAANEWGGNAMRLMFHPCADRRPRARGAEGDCLCNVSIGAESRIRGRTGSSRLDRGALVHLAIPRRRRNVDRFLHRRTHHLPASQTFAIDAGTHARRNASCAAQPTVPAFSPRDSVHHVDRVPDHVDIPAVSARIRFLGQDLWLSDLLEWRAGRALRARAHLLTRNASVYFGVAAAAGITSAVLALVMRVLPY
jgi:hypothetical protein